MAMKPAEDQYRAIPSHSDSELANPSPDLEEDGEFASLLGNSSRPVKGKVVPSSKLDRLVRIATLIIALCTLVDIILVAYLGLHRHFVVSPAAADSVVDADDLEIRSPYINLEQLYAEKPFLKPNLAPLVNHARAFVQIDRTQPDKVFPPYGLMRPLSVGMIPEFERRLLLTETVSTVAQWRVGDFGMESCSLTISVPPRESDAKDEIVNEPATIDVYTLPVHKKIDMNKLSYATRPLGATFFGSLPVSFNSTHELPAFPCQSGTYIAFEFRCSQPGCKIDVTGKAEGPSGLYITQYQTI
ncbi:hypothetical protein HMN09_00429400 [Mycena chlorophos]|uniref:Ubiquitin 3 binding protein But2 C-terminal domain-containing protein n=1 Tax=Mycena chlorophos TaxID=658473 RepID=A0A8H6WHF6_MYCCL|nr:hypothetical protein HMN09_00429400 [Mycena chlorophos]